MIKRPVISCEKTWVVLLDLHKKYLGKQLQDLLWDQLGTIVELHVEDTIVNALNLVVVERSD